MSSQNKLIYLSREQFAELFNTGSVTANGHTIEYNENDIYAVEDDDQGGYIYRHNLVISLGSPNVDNGVTARATVYTRTSTPFTVDTLKTYLQENGMAAPTHVLTDDIPTLACNGFCGNLTISAANETYYNATVECIYYDEQGGQCVGLVVVPGTNLKVVMVVDGVSDNHITVF